MTCELFATVPQAMESLLANGVKGFGAQNVKERRTGVSFSGGLEVAYRACLWSRLANRILLRLGEFEAKWDAEYLPIGQSWRRNWARLIPFFDYPPEIRKVIYTTNAIESVNMSLRKLTKNRGSFPSDEALLKLLGPDG